MDGILTGVKALVDDTLDVPKVGEAPHYRHREAWDLLARRRGASDRWPELVAMMASLIEQNWNREESSSRQNWRHSPQPDISEHNPSIEKRLEKGIVRAEISGWTNQVPICSGVNGARDSKRSVDLAYVIGEDLELIELKVESNTPLSAAIEVLEYGLVYRFSRKNRDELNYTASANPLLFEHRRVVLKVLAPEGYYYPDDHPSQRDEAVVALKRIEVGIDAGLAALPEDGYRMTFRFESFPPPPTVVDVEDKPFFRKLIAARKLVTAY